MDTSLAAAIHKENVHIIGGGKATVTMKPDKLKTVKTAGKKRKASADLIRSTHKPVAEASKDVDLKQNSAIKGNKIKKNQMTQGKRHAAVADRTTKKHHILIDEEIKKCCEWPKHILTEIKQHHEWLTETKQRREWDARALFMMTLGLFLRESISNLKPPSLGKAGKQNVPTIEDLLLVLQNHDMYFYVGHGDGMQYMDRNAFFKLNCCAAPFLIGCGSGVLTQRGNYAPYGAPLTYLFAGSPFVVANLWVVTD